DPKTSRCSTASKSNNSVTIRSSSKPVRALQAARNLSHMAPTMNREASVVRVQQSSLEPRRPERSGCLRVVTFLFVLFFSASEPRPQGQTYEKEGIAPASEATKKNPVAISQDSISAGQKIYLKRCAAGHGK